MSRSQNNWWNQLHSFFVMESSVTISNSATVATLIGSGRGRSALPAGFFAVSRNLRIAMEGYLSTGDSTVLMRVQVKIGDGVFGTTHITLPASLSDKWFGLDMDLVCRVSGAAGGMMGQGIFQHLDGSDFVKGGHLINTSNAPIDTTSAHTIDITASFASASTAQAITSTNLVLEFMHGDYS